MQINELQTNMIKNGSMYNQHNALAKFMRHIYWKVYSTSILVIRIGDMR